MAPGTATVADKPNKVTTRPTGKVTVKIDAELHQQARTIASELDVDLGDYLDSILRPQIAKDYDETAKRMQQRRAKGDK